MYLLLLFICERIIYNKMRMCFWMWRGVGGKQQCFLLFAYYLVCTPIKKNEFSFKRWNTENPMFLTSIVMINFSVLKKFNGLNVSISFVSKITLTVLFWKNSSFSNHRVHTQVHFFYVMNARNHPELLLNPL